MKKITLTIGIFISLMLNAQDIIWEEGFEAYQDFDIAIPEWNQWDLDSSPTYGAANFDFLNDFRSKESKTVNDDDFSEYFDD